jgi:hypothetical protein
VAQVSVPQREHVVLGGTTRSDGSRGFSAVYFFFDAVGMLFQLDFLGLGMGVSSSWSGVSAGSGAGSACVQ